MNADKTRRRFLFVPAVRHSSTRRAALSALQSVLIGYGLPTTEVDQPADAQDIAKIHAARTLTSLAGQSGLDARLRFVSVEHLVAPGLVKLPTLVWATPHEYDTERMLVLWRRVGPWVQVMDTARGVRWLRVTHLAAELVCEPIEITARSWRGVASSPEFRAYWLQRLRHHSFEPGPAADFIDQAQRDAGWYPLAAFDASIRMVDQLIAGGALRPGIAARTALKRLYEQALAAGPAQQQGIPDAYWCVVPASRDTPTGEQHLLFRGIWLIELAGPRASALPAARKPPVPAQSAADPALQPPSLGAQTLVSFLRREGMVNFSILGAALLFASGAVVFQAVLLRSTMTLGELFPSPYQHSLLLGLILLLVVVLLLMEWQINSTVARIGRRLDARLRMAVLEHLPAISAHTLQQHSTADQMERIHASRDLHNLPDVALRMLRTMLLLFFTLCGIAWIDPLSGLISLLIVVVTIGPFWIGRTLLDTLNLDTRTHLGYLMRFYLDGMLGLVPIQVHSAERMLRQVYERYLSNWIGSMLDLARAEFWVAALEHALSHGLIAITLLLFVARNGTMAELPLLVFWLFQLALLGRDFARQVFRTMNEQSKCTRFLELLDNYAQEEVLPSAPVAPTDAAVPTAGAGVRIDFTQVSVQAGDTTILHPFDLTITAGSQIAIVGPSGAGKSTLVGLLLGQHQASRGTIALDGQPLTPALLADLRQHTAWVDPLVQIWNRSLLYNLAYGGDRLPLADLVQQADLRPVMAVLPEGLQTGLGERGRLVSGGQGQRVRLGRSMQRPDARLVILDEPFRGLEREQRAALLARARAFWPNTTLICVTHDVGHTSDFERVLVVENGQIVEDGAPSELRECPTSRYRALLDAEQVVRERLWAGPDIPWRSLWLEGGMLQEYAPVLPAAAVSNGTAAPPDTPAALPPKQPPEGTTPREDESHPLTWNSIDVDAAVRALAYATGLRKQQPAPEPNRRDMPHTQTLEQQIEVAASQLNLRVEPLDLAYGELGQLLRSGEPALIELADQRLLLVSGSMFWWTSILTPGLKRRWVALTRVQDLICTPLHAPHVAHIDQTLAHLQLSPYQQAQAQRVLLRTQLADATISGIWLLRLPASAPLRQQVRQAGLLRYLFMALGGELFASLLYVAVFGLMILTIAEQQVAWGWLLAALLLVLIRVPAEMTRWLGEQFLAVGLRDIIKRRLFHGVLQLDPDRVKQHGTGQFLGWVMESERLEQAAQAVPFLLSTLVALGVAALLLAFGAGGPLHSLVLILWLLLMVLIGRGSLQAYLAQRIYHHQVTRDLLERMEGHQTRLVQEAPQRWHDEEDQELAHYHMLSQRDDTYRTLMAVAMPYGWLVISLLALLPAVLLRPEAWPHLGSSFLGILWVFQLLRASLTDVFDLIRAIGARRMLLPIEEAATHSDRPMDTHPCPKHLEVRRLEPQPLLEMQQVRFAYPNQERPPVADCALHIYPGNRLLLSGPSGGGKSTLAALLAGQRVPQAGMLLLYGLDRQTIGAACWRNEVVIAPQFHENHILDGPLLFNLLLGGTWPPTAADIAAAEALCCELGLAPLIERMPRGLYEQVGETGWQLSHGERSRVYIARALLQGASLIILDESFGSLDPHSMQAALRCALTHAQTLLVIAHP